MGMFQIGQTVTTPQGIGTIVGVGTTGAVEGDILVRLVGGGFARFGGSALYAVEPVGD
jgi:hypothetical protein